MIDELRRVRRFRLHADVPPELITPFAAFAGMRSVNRVRRRAPEVHAFVKTGARLLGDHPPDGRGVLADDAESAVEPGEFILGRFVVPVEIGGIDPAFFFQMRFNPFEIFRDERIVTGRTFFAAVEDVRRIRLTQCPAAETGDRENERVKPVFVEKLLHPRIPLGPVESDDGAFFFAFLRVDFVFPRRGKNAAPGMVRREVRFGKSLKIHAVDFVAIFPGLNAMIRERAALGIAETRLERHPVWKFKAEDFDAERNEDVFSAL